MAKVSVKRHLKELQWRLMIVAFFFILGAVLAYQFQEFLVPALLAPIGGEKLVYLNPAGGFSFVFLISIYAGLALSFPVFIQQIYAFLRPALPDVARKRSSIVIISSFLLLVGGITFGYFVAVPGALDFLYGFADEYVTASLTADSYLNFLISYTIGIGIVFQLPLLLLLIHSIKPLTPGGLMKSEKWVVLVAFIIAAIITPTPDPVNQTIIALPVIAVYQLGVVAILISIARQRSRAKRQVKLARKATVATAQPTPVPAPVLETPRPAPLYSAATQAQAQTQPQPAPAAIETPVRTPSLSMDIVSVRPITVQPRQVLTPTREVTRVQPRQELRAFRSIDGVIRQPIAAS